MILHKTELQQTINNAHYLLELIYSVQIDDVPLSAKTNKHHITLEETLFEEEEMEKTLRAETSLDDKSISNLLTLIFLKRIHDLSIKLRKSTEVDLCDERNRETEVKTSKLRL